MERRTQQARRFSRRRGQSSPACAVCVCGMRAACGWPSGLPLGSATHFHSVAIATQPVHRLQIRSPNSAELGGIPYHSPKLQPSPCNSVGIRPRTGTQTDTQTRVTTIHFSLSTTHAKCNKNFNIKNKRLRPCFQPRQKLRGSIFIGRGVNSHVSHLNNNVADSE